MVVSWTLGHFLAQYFYSRNKKNVSIAALADFKDLQESELFNCSGEKNLCFLFKKKNDTMDCLKDNKYMKSLKT